VRRLSQMPAITLSTGMICLALASTQLVLTSDCYSVTNVTGRR
jgi:hypothetical protein